MSTKEVKTAVKKTARPIDEKTGYRVGSLGYNVGRAYLSAANRDKAVESVKQVLVDSWKARKKAIGDKDMRAYAVAWVGFLHVRDEKIYKELPKVKKVTKEPVKA